MTWRTRTPPSTRAFADPVLALLPSENVSRDDLLAGIVKADALYDHLYSQERDIGAISLADAKARLSELVDRAEAGDSIDITRRGKPVARLTAVATPRKPIDAALLGALTATMPPQKQTAADLVRSMRDGDRY
jgi:prevent-host-death family protein